MSARTTERIAVFARNHLQYLEFAAAVAESDAERWVTFRSKKSWAGAGKALLKQGRVAVFFAVVGEQTVQFKANLQEVLLQPRAEDQSAQRLLRLAPPATEREGLWGNEVETLYAISGCFRLESPFPLSRLLKASDHSPLSADFRYSYALADEVLDETRDWPSPDTASPPARVQASITRIVRDTAMVCKLKVLYNDTCQVCGTRLALHDGAGYSEGHHLQPLGAPHNGPDVETNIVIVCPNCHALLDRCSLELLAERLKCQPPHKVSDAYLSYHRALLVAAARARA